MVDVGAFPAYFVYFCKCFYYRFCFYRLFVGILYALPLRFGPSDGWQFLYLSWFTNLRTSWGLINASHLFFFLSYYYRKRLWLPKYHLIRCVCVQKRKQTTGKTAVAVSCTLTMQFQWNNHSDYATGHSGPSMQFGWLLQCIETVRVPQIFH